jgi:acyl-CoA thioesterase
MDTAQPLSNAQDDASEARQRARAAADALYAGDTASRALGIELLEAMPGRVRVAMTVRDDMVNGHGICHGGILFTLADSAFAFACNSHGEAMVAAGASIEFLAPVAKGARLTATATETSRTARGGIYDVVVAEESGEPLAHFRGRCARLRLPAHSLRGDLK